MRKNYLFIILMFTTLACFSQVGIGTTTPEGALDISSTDGGLLVPRVSLTNLSTAAPVTNPQGGAIAESTLVYHDGTNSITAGFYYWNGSVWTTFGGADADWTVAGNDMYNANSGNVGIGNTAPTAKLHIQGTASLGGGGGTTNLLNEDFTSHTITQNHVSDPSCTTTDGWEIVGAGAYPCASCTGNRAEVDSDDSGCDQDATLIMNFTTAPTQTTINISFDYLYNDYSISGTDSFRAFLYNNDTASQVGADLVTSAGADLNTSYSGTATVVAGTNYSIRFNYQGSFAFGASVDNILVTETATGGSGTYMFRLQDGQEQNGYVLTSDANGNATWQAPSGGGGGGTDDQVVDLFSLSGTTLSLSLESDGVAPLTVDLSSLGGGGSSNSYENGLTRTGSTVRLGGTLTQNTTITLDDNDLTLQGSATAPFPGEFQMQGATRRIFETQVEEDYINFGGLALVDGDDGMAFTDSGGDPYTIDFVWGAHAGSSGGTGIAMGSIEYFVDGLNELLYQGSGIHPIADETSQFGNTLGASSRRWGAVYATNGVITTSDINMKKNIKPLHYGLNEIMKLETITYNWKDNTVGKTVIPENLTKKKIGFSAQQLHEVIPEVVQTHSWTTSDEEGNYKRIKNDKLGVYYSDLIPVTVKAIQEQQGQIDELKKTIEELKKQNELLMKLLDKK